MEIRFGNKAAHAAALRQIATEAHPGSPVYSLNNGGINSSVVRVDNFIYKGQHSGIYPPEVATRREAAVAKVLPPEAKLATGALLILPQLIASHPSAQPAHNKLSFVPGDVLPLTDIVNFDEAGKIQLGKDLGSFVVWLTNAIPADVCESIQSQAPNTDLTLMTALKELRLPHAETIRANGYRSTADLLEELANTPLPPYDDPGFLPSVTCHSDLRVDNLTFSNRRLSGVFDFEYLTRSDPAEELRFTGFMGSSVARAAIQQFYTETRVDIPLQRLTHYTSMQAIFAASIHGIHGEKKGNFSSVYQDFLKQQNPEKDWSELDRFVSSESAGS